MLGPHSRISYGTFLFSKEHTQLWCRGTSPKLSCRSGFERGTVMPCAFIGVTTTNSWWKSIGSQGPCLAWPPLPIFLGGVLEAHLETWAAQYPEESDLLRRSLYVDDLLTGGLLWKKPNNGRRLQSGWWPTPPSSSTSGTPTQQSWRLANQNQIQSSRTPNKS